MAEYLSRKRYQNHFGIDLKSNDLNRADEYASSLKNAQYKKSGSIEKRRGYQAHASTAGGYGLVTYNRVDTEAVEVPEIISISNTVHKLAQSTFTVVYGGADPSCLISIYFDTMSSVYKCQILEGTILVLDQSLGIGFDEAVPYTINDLATAINGLAGFTATITGVTTISAAFIPIVRNHNLNDSDYETTASGWSAVNTTTATPLSGSDTHANDMDFENVSTVQLNNVLFLSNGYDYPQKYDGQTLYRAGVPTPASITHALGGAGAVTGTNYFHRARYTQIDNSGNFVEGNLAITTNGLAPVAQSMNVTVANILAGSGFNTNCAVVAGAQAVVNTITVDDGSGGSHTMKVGDTAYFFDSVSSSYVERPVTAVAGTTITISGAAVTVADNAVISNNLRIGIYRNQTSIITPTLFYLVDEVPNNSFTATQVVADNITDAALGILLDEPITDRSPPPMGKYISAFKNQMIITGNRTLPTTVFFSDSESVEYFPSDSNSFLVDTVTGDIVTGIAPNNELFAIFKTKSIFIVTGNIADGTIRVDLLTQDVGCAAHASIQEVKGTLYFLSDRGPFVLTGGQLPSEMGDGRLEPVFDGQAMPDEIKIFLFNTQIITDEQTFQIKRAVALNDRTTEQYVLYIPCESTTSGDRHPNTNSKLFVMDYKRTAYLVWDSLNMASGATLLNNDLYFSERRYSDFTTNVDHILYRRHNLSDAWDYQDNSTAINFDYSMQWEALGEPALLKRFTRMRFYNFEETPNNEFELTIKMETNYVREVTKGSFVLEAATGGYGVSAYSTSLYGDPSEPTLKHKLNPGRVRSMRLRFQNDNSQQNIILPGWEIEACAPFKTGFKS